MAAWDLQEQRFQTEFPALFTSSAMRMTDFGSPVRRPSCTARDPVHCPMLQHRGVAMSCPWPRLVLRVDNCLWSLFGEKQKHVLIIKALQRIEWFSC